MNSLKFEWKKLLSVKSTWIAALCTLVSSALLGLLGISDMLTLTPAELPANWDPTAESLKGFLFAQLIIGMLGALAITPEYATGMIGSSVFSVPSRFRLLISKTLVVTVFAYITALLTTLLSFWVVQLTLAGVGLPSAQMTDPPVLTALFAGALYLTLFALIGLAIGVLTRSSTTSLSVLIGIALIIPALAPALPAWFERFWPITAGQSSYRVVLIDDALPPAQGMILLALTVLITWIISQLMFQRRDI
ncbi:ABC transporter permease [Saccharospirillum sp. HFRX-1]|uniref:ABC transporter permease n=1 Tax=unclassified Saccharospirillum TaxID=2633430 RepID=UPI003716555C